MEVYVHTSGDAAGASGGDVLAAGSGNVDEWFDLSQVFFTVGGKPSNSVSFTGRVYISGARYAGVGLGGALVVFGSRNPIATDTTGNNLELNTGADSLFDGGVGIDRTQLVVDSLFRVNQELHPVL